MRFSKVYGYPNITGKIGGIDGWKAVYEGAFYAKETTEVSVEGSGTNVMFNAPFSASNSNGTYGNSSTVQPSALNVKFIIKY